MGIFDNEYDLPGTYTVVNPDVSYGYDTSLFGTTDSEVVIGTAFNGPTGVVTPIYSKSHASYMFGKTYDSTRKIEASLVAGINDAWDRGCRTIYACRVGGKDMYKDFTLRVDRGLKLRVVSRFPSNEAKEAYFYLDNKAGDISVTLYKPADRATINERRAGLATSEDSVIATKILVERDYNLTRDDRLTDLIDLINDNVYNNTLRLAIVNRNGKEVTNSDEARKLPIGVLFSGAYFIGRDHSACDVKTEFEFSLVTDDNAVTPYSNFTDKYFRTLKVNTDVEQDLPIYAKEPSELREALLSTGITVDTSIDDDTTNSRMWDWLKISGATDKAFVPDKVDYEEADLSGFDLYQRLGCGYATTAYAEKRVDAKGKELTPRIKETPATDKNRVVEIPEGIYAILQDAKIKYRALVCAAADGSTNGKIPRAKDFMKTTAQTVTMLNNRIEIATDIDADNALDAKAYTFKFVDNIDEKKPSVDDIYQVNAFEVIPEIAESAKADFLKKTNLEASTKYAVKNGNGYDIYFFAKNKAEMIKPEELGNKKFIVAKDDTDAYVLIGKGTVTTKGTDTKPGVSVTTFVPVKTDGNKFSGKGYVLGSSLNNIYVYAVADANGTVNPMGDLTGLTSDNDETTVVYAESLNCHKNKIIVKSALFESITLEELIEDLNKHNIFGYLFTVALTNDGASVKTDYLSALRDADKENKALADADKDIFKEVTLAADRVRGYDYSMYIPYKTTDNFVRQLAQHCTYTELKTCPTWGSIGQSRMSSTDLSSVSKRVSDLSEAEYDLYAKNAIGRNMLDENGMPYPIGKNVSVVFMQYPTTIESESYNYISNGAAGYAGMVSNLPLDQSSTAQPFPLSSMPFSLTHYQLSRLTSKGIVTLRNSFTSGIVVTDGVTQAPVESIFRRLSASRVIGAVEEVIRAATEPYIGKQNAPAVRDAINTAIKSKLDKLVGTLIEKYDFNLVVDRRAMKLSYININYNIVPIYEIREFRNTISVKDSLESSNA